MKNYISTALIVMTFLGLGCSSEPSKKIESSVEKPEEVIPTTEAEQWILDAIEAHGGALYSSAHYQFKFRGKTYEFQNDGSDYNYHLIEQKENGEEWKHTLSNGAFSLTVNSDIIELSDKKENSYKEALNSVIYFATLPSKLSDEAVIADNKGETLINDTSYQLIAVQFEKENGGKDFKDMYLYWINQSTKKIDYLAYSFHDKEESGSRFRKAYNRRVVDGITFQDYINYKGEPGIDLYQLAKLYERGELEELSRIETENVISIN